MRSDRLPQFRTNHHTWSLGRWTTAEEHDSASHVLERGLQKSCRHAESDTCAPQRSLVVGHRPRIPLELLQSIRELEFALRNGKEEACTGSSNGHRRSSRLDRDTRARGNLSKTKHFLDLLGGVILVTAEDIGLCAFGIAKLVHLSLVCVSRSHKHSPDPPTMVPKVTKPTRAYCGSRLKLMMIESLSAFRLSSSWQVSTTKRKMGGEGAGRGSRYSMVVLLGCNSGGICSAEMSL